MHSSFRFFLICGLLSFALLTSCKAGPAKTASSTQQNSSSLEGRGSLQASKVHQLTLHPNFHLSLEELKKGLSDLNHSQLQGILAKPDSFLELVSQLLEESDPYLMRLVDKQNALPSDYSPSDLVALERYPSLVLNRQGLQLRSVLIPSLQRMLADAAQLGYVIPVSSTYRSYAYQKQVFERYAARDGLEAANRYSARPGESQHQLGLAVDFDSISLAFGETVRGRWLLANSCNYGFSLSYPKGKEFLTGYTYEPWHYRYIGIAACKLQQEYFNDLQQELLVFWKNKQPFFERAYSPKKSDKS